MSRKNKRRVAQCQVETLTDGGQKWCGNTSANALGVAR
jgi:hypothetical protein